MTDDPSTPVPPRKPRELMRRRNAAPLLPRLPTWGDQRAWLSSCVLHTFLFVSLAILWQPRTRGTGDNIDRPVGIAVVHQSNDKEEYFLSGGSAPTASETPAEAAAVAAAAAEASGPPVSLTEWMADLTVATDAGAGRGESSDGAGNGLSGLGTGSQGVGNGKAKSATSFMGLRGTGNSFVYVLDRSASMLEYNAAPMRFAKKELLKSIQSLTDRNQFQIVFYNESPGSLNPGTAGGKMLQANEINKDKATRFVQAIAPQGGTEHIPGLKMGLSFAPDVIFFLTDAAEPAIGESQLLEIQSRADRSLTTIHTIQFNRGPELNDGGWIRDLAEMNRGTYRYVDILTLE